MKKHLPKLILLLVLGTAAYVGYQKYSYNKTHEDTDNAQIETYFVPVLPRIAGYVKTVAVKDYDQVSQNEVLAEIDTEEGKLTLAELEADLAQSNTDVENASATIDNLNATLRSAEANLKTIALRRDKAKKDADRDAVLLADNAVTRKQADDSRSNYDILVAQYEGGQADLAAARSRMPILTAASRKTTAMLDVKRVKIQQQKLKLTYAKVYAPISGKIGRKSIEAGQFVQAGQPLMTIVKDSVFWVVANFKETQVNRLKIGAETELKLDAYPNAPLKGRILSIAESTGAKTSLLPPDNASGNFVKVTQRVPVKIEIMDVAKHRDILRAGLSLDVSVFIKD